MQRERVASVRLPRRAGGVRSKKKKLRGRAVSMQVATKARSIAERVAVEVDAFFNFFSTFCATFSQNARAISGEFA